MEVTDILDFCVLKRTRGTRALNGKYAPSCGDCPYIERLYLGDVAPPPDMLLRADHDDNARGVLAMF